MPLQLVYKDLPSFAYDLALKLGWKITHPQADDSYYNSVILWALDKIVNKRRVSVKIVSNVPRELIPNSVLTYMS